MRVAVTGARGYVGGAIVRALLERNHEVAALVRGPAPGLDSRVRQVTGDVREGAAIVNLVRGADAVVHTAAWVHKSADHAAARAECFSVNVGGTRTVVDALVAEGRRHIVYVSSIAVYGGPIEGATERTALHPTTAYGKSKLEAEQIVLDAARAGRLTACVLRPSVVYGPGAPGNSERLLSLVRRAVVPMVRGGANRKSVIHVDDLARVVVRAVEAGKKVNLGVYNVAGGALSVREMARALAEGARVPLREFWTPDWTWSLAAWFAHQASRASGGRLPDLGRTLEVFSENATVDTSRMARDLDVSFRDPYRGLVESVTPNGR